MAISLTELELKNGIWTGLVNGLDGSEDSLPEFCIWLHGEEISRVRAARQENGNDVELSVPIPPEAIASGAHTILIYQADYEDVLAKINLVFGHILNHEIVTEVVMLREELDLLKRAFRRFASQN